jgi:TolB-like protein/AraC-like DNA-binding protein
MGVIKGHLEEEQFGVSELARKMGMSRSNLHRRIHSITGKSASVLITETRLGKAIDLLKESNYTIAEVAYKVGFSSATYFTKCFHDHFGYPPGKVYVNESSAPVHSGLPENPVMENARAKKRLIPWMIATIAVLVAAGMVTTFILSNGRKPSENIVVAVLPFYNDSPGEENAWIVNGLLNEILSKLSLLDELEVLPRRSTDPYRDSDKNTQEIGRELGADYLLDGYVTVLNNITHINLELIETSTGISRWSESYIRESVKENPFEAQKEVALAVINELRVVLNREEKENISVALSDNPEAWEAYSKAGEILRSDYFTGISDSIRLTRAKQLLERAIELDPSFAAAYTSLGHLYVSTFCNGPFEDLAQRRPEFLDTGIFFVDRALSLYEGTGARAQPKGIDYYFALLVKATYFLYKGVQNEAERYYKLAQKGFPGNFDKYRSNCFWYNESNNIYACIENYYNYIESKPDDEVIARPMYYFMFDCFTASGFPELAKQFSDKILQGNGDSLAYFTNLMYLAMTQDNFTDVLRWAQVLGEKDPVGTDTSEWQLYCFTYMGDSIEAKRIMIHLLEKYGQDLGDRLDPWWKGYIHMQMGNKKIALQSLHAAIESLKKELEYHDRYREAGYIHVLIAMSYSILGNRDKTLEYLSYLDTVPYIDGALINWLKDWPVFDLVRDTTEFKRILKGMEDRYREEHEKIAKLLREHGINPA